MAPFGQEQERKHNQSHGNNVELDVDVVDEKQNGIEPVKTKQSFGS